MGLIGRPPEPRMTVTERLEYEIRQRERAEQERKRYLINQYGKLNNNQVAALSVKGSRAWLLQGPQLARSGILNADLFFKIASHLMKLSDDDTKYIFSAIHLKLFHDLENEMHKKYRKKYFFFNRSHEEFESKTATKRNDIVEKCENRMALISPRSR